MNYKKTLLYKQGLFYQKLGALLTNPKTTIKDIAALADKYAQKPFISVAQKHVKEKNNV